MSLETTMEKIDQKCKSKWISLGLTAGIILTLLICTCMMKNGITKLNALSYTLEPEIVHDTIKITVVEPKIFRCETCNSILKPNSSGIAYCCSQDYTIIDNNLYKLNK